MAVWHRSKPKPILVHTLRERNPQRRGIDSQIKICWLCSGVLKVIFLGLFTAAFLMLHWNTLSSDPFPNSRSESALSSFYQGNQQNNDSASSLRTSYWMEQESQNDRACISTERHLQNGGKVLLYNFTSPSNGPGMASLTLNLLQIALFMHERWNRTHLAIDERLLNNYRWDANHGLFGGFLYLLETCILTTSKSSTYSSSSPSLPEVVFFRARKCNYWDVKCPVLEIDANPQGYMFEKARRVTKRYFLQKKGLEQKAEEKEETSPVQQDPESKRMLRLTRFFHDLSRFSCSKLPGLRLHPHVHRLVQQHGMFLAPEDEPTTHAPALTVDSSASGLIDLAFHIRRGDKVAGARKETRAFIAQEYWDRFVNQSSQLLPLPLERQHTAKGTYQFHHCFVATDDYEVVSELQAVLQRPQHSSQVTVEDQASVVPCHHLWTLTPPNYTSTWQDRDEIFGFLAQMRVLIRAKYFVGSFSSNVGGLVALLRSCHYHHEQNHQRSTIKKTNYNETNRYRHFFDSYAVDWDEWGIL